MFTDDANFFPSIMVGDVCGGKKIDLKTVAQTCTQKPDSRAATIRFDASKIDYRPFDAIFDS